MRQELAERFAYYLIFAREIPFEYWPLVGKATPKPWWHAFRSLEDLLPGRDKNLDVICDHILYGREAIAADSV